MLPFESNRQKLEALQHWFVRLVLRVGPGCPAPSLRWETGLLSMRMRIWVEKLMLVRHVRGLDISTIARRVYEEQKLQKWPGLRLFARCWVWKMPMRLT